MCPFIKLLPFKDYLGKGFDLHLVHRSNDRHQIFLVGANFDVLQELVYDLVLPLNWQTTDIFTIYFAQTDHLYSESKILVRSDAIVPTLHPTQKPLGPAAFIMPPEPSFVQGVQHEPRGGDGNT